MEMARAEAESGRRQTTGLVLHWACAYDWLVWVVMRGRERAFRERLVRLARVKRGDRVLDVGCGTGSLALVAGRLIPSATITGIDASPEMVARARKKAVRAGANIDFQQDVVEKLPFADAAFDAVFSTMMLHHLGAKLRRQGAAEIRRVLKPGGRWLLVDFEGPARAAGGILSRFHRHGHIKSGDLSALAIEAGLEILESGPLGVRNLHYVLAAAPERASAIL